VKIISFSQVPKAISHQPKLHHHTARAYNIDQGEFGEKPESDLSSQLLSGGEEPKGTKRGTVLFGIAPILFEINN